MPSTRVATERRRLLRIYLNDHLAGAALGTHLVRRCLSSNEGTPLGGFLEDLLGEVAEDRAVLEGLMDALELPRDRVKQFAALVAERVGRVKLNGSLRTYSDLSRLEELEGIYAGVTTKLRLWASLQAVAPSHPAVAAMDLTRLVDRGVAQLERLEVHRLEAAVRALA